MVAPRVRIEVLGDRVIEGNFDKHRARAENPMPAFALLATRFLEVEKLQFESQGAEGGSPWAPLAESTLAEKARLGLDMRTLFRTHALFDSLTNASAPGHVRRITPEVLELGTAVASDGGYPYAEAHQHGRGVPVRKPVDLNDLERGSWAKTVHRYITTGELYFGMGVRV